MSDKNCVIRVGDIIVNSVLVRASWFEHVIFPVCHYLCLYNIKYESCSNEKNVLNWMFFYKQWSLADKRLYSCRPTTRMTEARKGFDLSKCIEIGFIMIRFFVIFVPAVCACHLFYAVSILFWSIKVSTSVCVSISLAFSNIERSQWLEV